MSKLKNALRCIHRHTIETHPSCFAIDNVQDNRKDPKVSWWLEEGHKIAYIDIETDALTANFGTMLSFCVKEKDGELFGETITKKDIFNGTFDKNIVRDLVRILHYYPITVGYYSSRFDIPFIRTKALYYLARDPSFIEFPRYGEFYHWDLYFTVRNKLSLSRNSLEMATTYLNIPGKSHIDPEIWRLAKYGDPKALQVVLEHNQQDVLITEKLHSQLLPFRKWIRTSM